MAEILTSTTLTSPDGISIAVESCGAGPPIVFAHGSNGGLDSWRDVASRIEGFRTIRYARRNHAPSGKGASPNDFAVDAADLHSVLAAVAEPAGERAHVVGGSFGATVALHAAVRDEGRIASLTLFEPPLLLAGPHLAPVVDRYRSLCAARQFADALTLFLREVARVPAAVLADGPPVPDSEDAAIAAGGDLAAMSRDITDTARWSAIGVPVLLLQGELTWPPLPEGMEQLSTALPHAQRTILAGQSHFATATDPAGTAGAIQRFLAAVN